MNLSLTETPLDKTVYLSPENLLSSFQTMGKSLAVTTRSFHFKGMSEVRDLDWNLMDQLHRPCVHRTYEEALRLATGRSFAVSLTRVGPLKLFTLVIDIQLGPGLFYQGMTLFNLIYLHSVIRSLPEGGGVKVEFYIVSHRLFKFLHGFLHRRLLRLNEIQNAEDEPIRDQRTFLRSKGYRFETDEPNYLNSNTLTDKVIPPQLDRTYQISLKGISADGLKKVSAGPVDLLVRKNSDQNFTVWTAVCPHEGGPLESGKICNGTIVCPWHGLSQSGVEVSPGRSQNLGGLQIAFDGNQLIVS